MIEKGKSYSSHLEPGQYNSHLSEMDDVVCRGPHDHLLYTSSKPKSNIAVASSKISYMFEQRLQQLQAKEFLSPKGYTDTNEGCVQQTLLDTTDISMGF